ncbi:hypothetical protein OIY81_2913 [Cryptosporidium canis]|uniref:Uncharacterized protein n=1 Tax=Cryptosporidium canis TaxID=195482 RepID=A0ABQ8P5N2_9CRYT|nr:hypothetical protein OIY81_2913 [Cryptosporidium canis]KAJ1609139.1 hypothetical protein OJ252_2291 [Cryptosporidium canis]
MTAGFGGPGVALCPFDLDISQPSWVLLGDNHPEVPHLPVYNQQPIDTEEEAQADQHQRNHDTERADLLYYHLELCNLEK